MDTEIQTPAHQPQRSWLPSPGKLSIVALLLGVGVVYVQVGIPYQRTLWVARELDRLGEIYLEEPGGPEWLRDVVGHDWMRGFDRLEVISIYFDHAGAGYDSSRLIGQIARCDAVKDLDLSATDDDLLTLSRLPDLGRLCVYEQVTDEGLLHLRRFPALRMVEFHGSAITDDGLRHLQHVDRLREVVLSECSHVTNEGLRRLKLIPGLRRIQIDVFSGIRVDMLHVSGAESSAEAEASDWQTEVNEVGEIRLQRRVLSTGSRAGGYGEARSEAATAVAP